MTFDNDNDVNVYFRQALRATLFTPAYFSVVLTGLKFIMNQMRETHQHSFIFIGIVDTSLL